MAIVAMPDIFSLQGKTAIVTGAGGLLGAYHCRALIEAGARVYAADLDPDASRSVADNLHRDCIACEVDVTDKVSISRLLNEVIEAFGTVEILVNNAAINDMYERPELALEQSSFEKYPLDLWKRSLEVNVTGPFLCSQIIGSKMAECGAGSIINIASTYAIVAPDQSLYKDRNGHQQFYKSPVYPTAKGAIISFTRYLAAYWGHKGVRVNTLSPGGVENGQDEHFVAQYSAKTPMNRMAVPSDYMGALIFLASDASAYMTGANLVVDGGFTVW